MSSWQLILNDEHARHALLVHFPIVLSLIGVIPLVALAFTGFKSVTLKWVCIGCFALASLGGYFAKDAGHDAASHVIREMLPKPTKAERSAIGRHADLGNDVWFWSLLPAVLIGVSLTPKRKVAVIAGSLGLAAGIWAGVWVARTGDAGGRLVYVYGLGVPERGEAVNGVLPHHHDADEDADHDADHDEPGAHDEAAPGAGAGG